MEETDILLSDKTLVSFLLKKTIDDAASVLMQYSFQKESIDYRWGAITISNAIDIVRTDPNKADQVVWEIIAQRRSGSSERFLELIDLLQGNAQWAAAFFINTYALKQIKYCGDLYATEIELLLEWENAQMVNQTIQELIDTYYPLCYSMRFGRAACAFFCNLAKDASFEQREKLVAKGLVYACNLKMEEPASEWGYYWEVKLLWLVAPKTAKEKLQACAGSVPPPEYLERVNDSQSELYCPLCRQMYIEVILRNSAFPCEVIYKIAEKGRRDAKWLKEGTIPPKEKKEMEKLHAYFQDEIDRVSRSSDWGVTETLIGKQPHMKLDASTGHSNIIETHKMIPQKVDEED